ncbi:MAG: aminoglycoside adenylyltransferase [Lachnospiraceae bacterium]
MEVLDLLEHLGIPYWLDGGWGVDVLMGKQTRKHQDVDIDFDAHYTDTLVSELVAHGYAVEMDLRPVRMLLYHPARSHIDIHPFVLLNDGMAKQADGNGGWYKFEADYFGSAMFEGRSIPCISAKGQRIFHTGYELRESDKHDIKNIDSLL